MILSHDQQIKFLKDHLLGDYEVLSDYAVEINGCQYFGDCNKKTSQVYKMVFSDVGGVWESPRSLSLTQNWARYLEKTNHLIGNRSEEFRKNLHAVELEDDPLPPTQRLMNFLQDCNLTEDQHLLACDYSARETEIVRN